MDTIYSRYKFHLALMNPMELISFHIAAWEESTLLTLPFLTSVSCYCVMSSQSMKSIRDSCQSVAVQAGIGGLQIILTRYKRKGYANFFKKNLVPTVPFLPMHIQHIMQDVRVTSKFKLSHITYICW